MDSQIELKDEKVDTPIVTKSLTSGNSEDEAPAVGEDDEWDIPIQSPFLTYEDQIIFRQYSPSEGKLEPSFISLLPSNYDDLAPGDLYWLGNFPVVKGKKGINPLGPQTCRSHTVKGLTVSVDAEWHNDGSWLSTSFTTNVDGHSMRHFFVTNTLPVETLERLKITAFFLGDKFHSVPADELYRHFLPTVIEDADPYHQHMTITLLMFYSPKDLEFSLGWEFIKPLYMKDDHGVTQKRCLTGRFTLQVGKRKVDVEIRDLAGVKTGGLLEWVKGLGVDIKDKGCMDEYKTRMRDGFIEKPDLAYAYSRNDADLLHHAYVAFEELVKWVECDVIGIPHTSDDEDLYELKQTTGSLIANTFTRFLMSRSTDENLLKFAIQKLGILDVDHKKASEYLQIYTKAINTITNRNAFYASGYITAKFLRMRRAFKRTALGQCSVEYFANQKDSSAFNALVQGGRCNNERPTEYRLEHGADIDLSGCYGTALREFIYPVGLPTVWGNQSNQIGQTLGDWLEINENQLVDNLWTATVTGSLDFIQDLIYSKIVTQGKINNAAGCGFDKETNDDDRDDDPSHIPGDFALIRKEIQNGIITSEILKVINAVATNTECTQFMKLTVVSAAAYLKCDRVTNIETWIDVVLKDRGKSENVDHKSGNTTDTRTRKWCPIPLEDFIGKLVDERSKVKATDKAKSNALKLFINTLYGDLASPYFQFGNTVIANNITARARVGVWMLNKTLHTRQSITDGGIYTPVSVPMLKPGAKKPGIDRLADNGRWQDRKRAFKPLGDVDWKSEYEAICEAITGPSKDEAGSILNKLGKHLDELATKHVAEFWQPYSLSLPFKIEHKGENTFSVGVYTSKAHYALKPLTATDVKGYLFKIRGARDFTEGELKRHPTYDILTSLLDGKDDVLTDLQYDHTQLLKKIVLDYTGLSRNLEQGLTLSR